MRRLVRLACVIAALFSWAAFEIATDSVGVFVSAQTVGQDVGPGVAQIGSIQGTTSATCSVYRATGGAIVIAGTWVGTLQFESSVDGTNYLALPVTPQAGGATVTSTAANGTWNFSNAGYVSPSGVRVRASAWTSGTATINCTTVGASYFLANGNTVTALGPLTVPLTWAASGGTADTVIYRTAAGAFAFGNGTQGDITGTLSANAMTVNTGGYTLAGGAAIHWVARGFFSNSAANANFIMQNEATTVGSNFKVDALPTAGTCGTSPAVTAGSTPLAGSINVGTGGVATSCTVTFNGTAFPSAPFVVCMNQTTAAAVKCAATTTVLTITGAAAFAASDVIAWVAISSK